MLLIRYDGSKDAILIFQAILICIVKCDCYKPGSAGEKRSYLENGYKNDAGEDE